MAALTTRGEHNTIVLSAPCPNLRLIADRRHRCSLLLSDVCAMAGGDEPHPDERAKATEQEKDHALVLDAQKLAVTAARDRVIARVGPRGKEHDG